MKKIDVLVVGAGFAGSVCARELADAGFTIKVIDKRPHIGGNAWDTTDNNGFLIHPYGPHIFHTNSRTVFAWLSQFTAWRFYEHKVLANVSGVLYPFPINRITLNKVYGENLKVENVQEFLDQIRDVKSIIKTSEDVVLNSVGKQLCEMFFRGYTKKQWGLDLSELSAGVASRVPARINDDDRYFEDTFQFMPANGYALMFEKILDHPNITVKLGVNFSTEETQALYRHIVYTGPIDEFFGYKFGKLPYRSLRFEHYHLPTATENCIIQGAPVVNFPNEHLYTRITEFKQITGQKRIGSSLVKEYPQAEGDPYYPVPRTENEEQFKSYALETESLHNVTFVGRLAQYRYYNMDQVVASALKKSSEIKTKLSRLGGAL
jgi:UDP-galactopyranose mutase